MYIVVKTLLATVVSFLHAIVSLGNQKYRNAENFMEDALCLFIKLKELNVYLYNAPT